ncbi:MAG: tetratricopeptide repeat protein [Bacillota bacterium]
MAEQARGREILNYLEQAKLAVEREDYPAARAFFRQIIAIDEVCGAAWYGLGLIALWQGNVEEAYECLSEFATLTEDKELAAEIETVLYYLERYCAGEGGGNLEPLFGELKRFQARCLISHLVEVGQD